MTGNSWKRSVRHKSRQDEINCTISERVDTIRYLQQHKNNISGRVAEIRDEILEAVGATAEEIPFIGELIRVKDIECDWEYAIERILHNFRLEIGGAREVLQAGE